MKISEATKVLGVSAETLKAWESKSLIPKPGRTVLGRRNYSEGDIKKIQDYIHK